MFIETRSIFRKFQEDVWDVLTDPLLAARKSGRDLAVAHIAYDEYMKAINRPLLGSSRIRAWARICMVADSYLLRCVRLRRELLRLRRIVVFRWPFDD